VQVAAKQSFLVPYVLTIAGEKEHLSAISSALAAFGASARNAIEIHVVTKKNIVQLSGFVDSRPMIGRVSDVAGKVAGVRSVQNDLVVR
jgi:osmotically-inducible protein OsmY